MRNPQLPEEDGHRGALPIRQGVGSFSEIDLEARASSPEEAGYLRRADLSALRLEEIQGILRHGVPDALKQGRGLLGTHVAPSPGLDRFG